MTEVESKQHIKNLHLSEFDIILEMILENPKLIGKQNVSNIDIAEFYLKSLKTTEKWAEIYNRQNESPKMSDIDCQIQYSFFQNGVVI